MNGKQVTMCQFLDTTGSAFLGKACSFANGAPLQSTLR
ncbi:hypothetical protein COO91_07206 [Nostoc flagelliforme CCNUN1]|uniref:Uncharacterized protein n=1 Tax=Nostoc flagelliforme CCNUN1 TaxID=2038116 RepID=A0A2K8T0F7_9NOSO|nr:hypothetical protein COO91_07206 [Nostoc flagelliforme CCNUN1]